METRSAFTSMNDMFAMADSFNQNIGKRGTDHCASSGYKTGDSEEDAHWFSEFYIKFSSGI